MSRRKDTNGPIAKTDGAISASGEMRLLLASFMPLEASLILGGDTPEDAAIAAAALANTEKTIRELLGGTADLKDPAVTALFDEEIENELERLRQSGEVHSDPQQRELAAMTEIYLKTLVRPGGKTTMKPHHDS